MPAHSLQNPKCYFARENGGTVTSSTKPAGGAADWKAMGEVKLSVTPKIDKVESFTSDKGVKSLSDVFVVKQTMEIAVEGEQLGEVASQLFFGTLSDVVAGSNKQFNPLEGNCGFKGWLKFTTYDSTNTAITTMDAFVFLEPDGSQDYEHGKMVSFKAKGSVLKNTLNTGLFTTVS